jgi:hypothetical protein
MSMIGSLFRLIRGIDMIIEIDNELVKDVYEIVIKIKDGEIKKITVQKEFSITYTYGVPVNGIESDGYKHDT